MHNLATFIWHQLVNRLRSFSVFYFHFYDHLIFRKRLILEAACLWLHTANHTPWYQICHLGNTLSNSEVSTTPISLWALDTRLEVEYPQNTRLEHNHDDVIKWKHFPRNWPFVRGIHRSPVNSTHKGQWRGALMFSLICVWINLWVNNGEAGDLRLYRAHYDVSVMELMMWKRFSHYGPF